ncbi:UDP:flavonoid glycosyltransferase YjiC (YdhE family) [Actinoalloteichus hoggarensis]|uniref:4'-demethylrebeccamycin synthase n=1 Tax=Actinoalloteichus hoggarensis TaxID=1470176 RepID=A0A221W2R4_9PSEU|nr:nucleotide disphospho-sugar-binding domain-containing protein [Actinoalloteichus hoggarensis]ASO20120.1 4'-demethylrebeccamycin synthase [Actinoalloteichus hoggarensis]MBB5919168.1 UDP:flavonoid glycosyltransferase YjiC (YdhE family) [Actinoalloteichus hoggarensis]
MTRVLIAAVPIHGHVTPMRAIARNLVERGYPVTFLTGQDFRESVERTGARFRSLPSEADLTGPVNELFPERDTGALRREQIEFDMRLTIHGLSGQHAAMQEILAEADGEPVVLVHETLFMGGWPVRLGAPGLRPAGVVGIGVIPVPISSIDHAPWGMGLPPDSSSEGRARNRFLNDVAAAELQAGVQRELAAGLAALGATEEPPLMFDGLVAMPDRFLQLTIGSMDYPRSDAPPRLRHVGALPAEPPEDVELPEWWDELITASRVVVVTQGTLANADLSRLIEPAVRALADLDALVVVTTGSDVIPDRLPANARAARYLPFDLLLPHADVLISNGGYGGVHRALWHGVPMVLAGDTEDKVEVGALAAWAGAAINLATGDPDEADIRKAVDAVLTDPTHARRAEELRAECLRQDPHGTIAAAVEELARRTE